MKVVLADYGAGNLRSVTSAFARAGAEASITTDPRRGARRRRSRSSPASATSRAPPAGLPRTGLDDALRDRVAAGRPVLGICVGMQLLFGASEEGGSGLELLAGPVRRIRARTVPHMGWNDARRSTDGAALVAGLDGRGRLLRAQLSRSSPRTKRSSSPSPTTTAAIVAAVERDGVAGVQFHPERSAHAGARLLENALAWSRSA